jgi:iron complex outermembrane recepter protein
MKIISGARRAGRRSSTSLLGNAVRLICAAGTLGALTAPVSAQQPSDQTSSGQAPIQEVVVTGSLIKRTDTETPSPVQILTDADIKSSGYTQVSQVLQNLSANGAGTLSQGFGQAFASGASGIALRGLTVGDTLTLIDGERMVAYPLADDGERSFVDVTAIPINVISGIDVLKDGASASYGADAIAGVVNIKLKPDYVGTEITGDGGATQHNDGWTWHLAAIHGFGDLASDGYNMYMAIDWHRQELIWGSNRSGAWTNLNWSFLPGGVNTTPGAIGSQNLTYPDSATGYLLNSAGNIGAFLPGCTAAQQLADKCTFSFPGQIQPPTEQTNFLTKFTKALSNDWKFIVTASLFDSVAQQTAPPSEPAFGHLLQQTGAENGSLPLIAWGPYFPLHINNYPALSLPASSPLNPLGAASTLVYSFPDVGPWVVNTDTQTYRLYGDLKGQAAGWDIDATIGIMYAKMNLDFDGGLIPSATQTALNNGSYVPGAINNSDIGIIAPQANTSPSSTLDVIDVHGQHDIVQMYGGPLTALIGAQYIHKAVNDQDPPSIANGYQEGITNFTVGSQDDTAAFLELQGKPIKPLELDAAVRYDHYDTYGGQATPKFGVTYKPVDMVMLRGTWGKGFRAPSISESGNSGIAFGEGNAPDPVLCANGANVKGSFNAFCSYPITGVEPGNPNLKAVTSTNATIGVVFEPIEQFNASVDWYRIQINNDILSATVGGLSNYATLVRGSPTTALMCTNTVTTGTCNQVSTVTPVGVPIYDNFPYLNAGSTKTSGIDLELQTKWDLGTFGRLKGQIDYTYISQYEITVAGVTYDVAGTHGPSGVSGDTGNPRQRAVATITWDEGPFSATLTGNYTGSFKVTDPSTNWYTCLAALQNSGNAYGAAVGPTVTTLAPAWNQYCSVNHFTSFNLYARYAVTDHVSVHGSITNLFNAQPPVDLETYGGGAMYRYTTLDQDGAVGRFFSLGATLTF